MLNTIDLYLGTFLVLSGFALSLFNLRRIVKKSDTSFSSVLLSENVLLMCIGIAFVSRASYEFNTENVYLKEIETRSVEMMKTSDTSMKCNFWSVLMSYGPMIVSLVNSFLSLIIDNYMHYRMLAAMRENDEDNQVQEFGRSNRNIEMKNLYVFFKKYFSFIAIVVQWITPILMVFSMYPMGVKEMTLPVTNLRSVSDSCMAILEINNDTCSNNDLANFTLELRKDNPSINYLEVVETSLSNNMTSKVDSVIKNIYKIVNGLKNNTKFMDVSVTSPYLFRKSKSNEKCMKMCYMDNKKLLLYMFLLAVVSYFIPITISTIILTKIHIMDTKKPNTKTYVSRELLYNILFWTPVMFDTFLSLILCSYTMNGMRTSLLNVIANIYQAVKNFMNTKYFKNNTVVPV